MCWRACRTTQEWILIFQIISYLLLRSQTHCISPTPPPSHPSLLFLSPPLAFPPSLCSLSGGLLQVGVGSGALLGVSLQQQDQPGGLHRL